MKVLEGKEICDAICCYSDFQLAKNKNSNFVLTNKNELYYDLRLIDQVEHSDKKFWLEIR